MSPKNIVFCADGTWNGDNQDPDDITHPTNVLKLYQCLSGKTSIDSIRRADEQEKVFAPAGEVLQVSKYLHGVGDSSNWLVKLIGGTIGTGLIARVIRGYTFVSRNYVRGDRIYLTGFSRGAYTVRALAGLIAAKGLLDATKLDLQDDRDSAYKLGSAVWCAYRREVIQQKKPDQLGEFEELVTMLPNFFSSTVVADDELVADVKVNTVAVWDTVGALGIPKFDNTGTNIEPLQFVNTTLSPQVLQAYQATSLDEQRANFPPCFFDADLNNPGRIVQVLFPGAHSDVGGGYPESDLSDGALEWMINRLVGRGLLLLDPLPVDCKPDALGVAHQPVLHSPWLGLPKVVREGGAQMRGDLMVHASILARRAAASVVLDISPQLEGAYAPANLGNYIDPTGALIAERIFQEP